MAQTRYIPENEVYKLFENKEPYPTGLAKLHVGEIDALPRFSETEIFGKLIAELEESIKTDCPIFGDDGYMLPESFTQGFNTKSCVVKEKLSTLREKYNLGGTTMWEFDGVGWVCAECEEYPDKIQRLSTEEPDYAFCPKCGRKVLKRT